ncbi:DUF11 domain-containing protein [Myxococcaceae bacterium JPH2]|nr:DUF11 domain-containing protein [Myxococcaceae bacterium JPH2]
MQTPPLVPLCRAPRSRAFSLAALLVFLLPVASRATPGLRHQEDQHGDFVLIGNTLAHECAVGTPAPVVGTVGTCGSSTADTAPDVFWTLEGSTTRADLTVAPSASSSQAMLTLPPGALITYARLYWGATRSVPAVTGTLSPDTQVTLRRPGGFTQAVSSDAEQVHSADGVYAYQSTADVTALLQAQGPGIYGVTGVDAVDLRNVNDANPFTGWSLIVFYRLDSEPLRNLTLFDGLDKVVAGSHTDTALSGFLVPQTGFSAKLGVIAYEGDNTITGDQLVFNGVALSDAVRPQGNFFNGSRSYLGQPVSNAGDLPRLTGTAGSMSGLDLGVVDVTSRVSAGQTSASVSATSTGDGYWLGAFVTSISTQEPDFNHTVKSVRTLATHPDGGARAGDLLEYTLTTRNSGTDTGVSVVLVDPLSPKVALVPDSLQVVAGANAGVKTDIAGDDSAEYDAAQHRIVFRLGSGATGTQGGVLAPGEGATVSFRVVVRPGVTGPVDNQAFITSQGLLGAAATTVGSAPGEGQGANPTRVVLTLPPAPEVTQPSEGALLGGDTPTFAGTAEPGSSVSVVVDGTQVCTAVASASGAWSCTSTVPLLDGAHSGSATTQDAAGNVSPATGFGFATDATAPSVTLTVTPSANTSFEGTADPGSTVTLVIDGTAHGPIPVDVHGHWTFIPPEPIPDGSHTATATSTDTVGHTSTPVTVPFEVDTVAPDTFIDAGPALTGASAQAVFDFSASEASVTYVCSVDGQPYVPCADPAFISGLADGGHTLSVSAIDATGNVDPTPARYAWTVGGGTGNGGDADGGSGNGGGIDGGSGNGGNPDGGTGGGNTDGGTGNGGDNGSSDGGTGGGIDGGSGNGGDTDGGTGGGIDGGSGNGGDTDGGSGNGGNSDGGTGGGNTDGGSGNGGNSDGGPGNGGDTDGGSGNGNGGTSDGGPGTGGNSDGGNGSGGGDGSGNPDGSGDGEEGTHLFSVAGHGCGATGPSDAAPLALLLLLLPWMIRRRGEARSLTGMAAVLAVLVGSTSRAQDSASQAIDAQQYKPGPGAFDVLGVQSAQVASHLSASFGVSVNYADKPLSVLMDGQYSAQLVKNQLTADFLGSISLGGRLEMGVAIPITGHGSQPAGSADPGLASGTSGVGLGDIRLVPKLRLLSSRQGLHLAVSAPVVLPTSGGKDFLGESGPSFQPRLVGEWSHERIRLMANAGVVLRRSESLLNLKVGHALTYAVGAEVPLGEARQLLVEASLAGSMGLQANRAEERPLEVLGALKYRFAKGLAVHLGAGPGIGRGYGTPAFRAFGGLTWSPSRDAPREE